MKKSLFKKNEITRKEAGKIVGGFGRTGTGNNTIGMKDTSRYVIPWGMVPDSEFADDHQDYDTDEPV